MEETRRQNSAIWEFLKTHVKYNKIFPPLEKGRGEFFIKTYKKSLQLKIKFANNISDIALVPSSSGLGHGPLKAKTRVQISLESPIKITSLLGGLIFIWYSECYYEI